MGKTPKYEQSPLDPRATALADQAKVDEGTALQAQLRGDSASLMARYGTLLTMAGAANLPRTI